MLTRLRNEPALIFSLVEAVAALAGAFGLHLPWGQAGAILGGAGPPTRVSVRAAVYGPRTVDTIMDADTVISAAERTPEL